MAQVPPPESNRPPPESARPPPEPTKPPTERPRTNTGSRMSRPLPKAKVMFTYTASQEDEITVLEGETVEVVDRNTDQDGWWKVKKGTQEGLVPDNFLELQQSIEKRESVLPWFVGKKCSMSIYYWDKEINVVLCKKKNV